MWAGKKLDKFHFGAVFELVTVLVFYLFLSVGFDSDLFSYLKHYFLANLLDLVTGHLKFSLGWTQGLFRLSLWSPILPSSS